MSQTTCTLKNLFNARIQRYTSSRALLAKLGKHTAGGACLYIKKLADVDQQVLETLATKSVAAIRARYRS